MYLPKHFAETDVPRLHAAIERYSFATLVSSAADRMQGSHLPLLLDRESGPAGTLVGHMARANLQWREAAGKQVLAIFHGPHAYVSPAWYEADEVVPTWNYVAIHAQGTLTPIEDARELLQIVARTVRLYESGREHPWRLDEQAEYVARLLPQIVGFRIPVDRLEGKWKLNQNHPPARRRLVIQALDNSARLADREVAALMKESWPTTE
jgi:transcriptional regulator